MHVVRQAISGLGSLVVFALGTLIGSTSAHGQTVTLTGASNNQVFTNGQKITLIASVTGADGDHQTLSIYDGNKFLFGRPFGSASQGDSYSFAFEWFDPPIGTHALQAVRVEISPLNGNPIATNRSPVINIRVVGRSFGFAGISNLFTSPSPERANQDTQFGCSLVISNQTATSYNPLRVRLLKTQTYYYVTNEFQSPPPTNSIPFSESIIGLPEPVFEVGPHGSITVSVPSNNICPALFYGGDFGEAQVQSHVYALLEEQMGSDWVVADAARLIYSIPEPASSPSWNYGAKGINPPNTANRIALPTGLAVAGPTNHPGGATITYQALAGFNGSSGTVTGAVKVTWVSSSPLLTVESNGMATAAAVADNVGVELRATYVRGQQTFMATHNVTLVPGPTVTLSGVSNGQVFTNGEAIRLMASAANVATANNRLWIYDGDKPVFGRPFDTNVYSFTFDWFDPPLGDHALQAVLIDADNQVTYRSPVLAIRVVGRAFGFVAVHDLIPNPNPQQPNADTSFGCRLEIRNQTDANSNPLRVRLLTTQTYYYVSNANDQPPPINTIPFSEVTNTTSLASNFTVTSNFSFFVSVPETNICPATQDTILEDFRAHFQFHVYAILEERIGNAWSIVDATRIIYSILGDMFPYNDGAIAMNPLTSSNRVAYPTDLVIVGPTNLMSGAMTSYVAVATLSDNASGTISPIWSSSSPLLSINANGGATVGNATSNTTVLLTSSYTRSYVTKLTTQRVAIAESVAPPMITTPLQNLLVPVGSNATFTVSATGSAPLSYSWRFGTTPITGATGPSHTVNNAQLANAGSYTVTVTNPGGSASSTALLSVVDRPLLRARFVPGTDRVELILNTTPGHNCTIEWATNFAGWQTFSNLPSPASQTIMTDTVAPGFRRFYRARVNN
ncbi:MAG: immunoglobulin domain-containing protein [Verrucomicrobia subdivision 3 bacterium]|nr:immunoglobulin domain-containing protein [Limisphaerales bacterium]